MTRHQIIRYTRAKNVTTKSQFERMVSLHHFGAVLTRAKKVEPLRHYLKSTPAKRKKPPSLAEVMGRMGHKV